VAKNATKHTAVTSGNDPSTASRGSYGQRAPKGGAQRWEAQQSGEAVCLMHWCTKPSARLQHQDENVLVNLYQSTRLTHSGLEWQTMPPN
jgi:hypothetical protein